MIATRIKAMTHDRNVFASLAQRFAKRPAVPAFNDLWAGQPQAGSESAAGQMVKADRRHGGHRRCARAKLHDARADMNLGSVRQNPCRRGDCVRAIKFAGAHDVIAQTFDLFNHLKVDSDLSPAAAGAQSQTHVAYSLSFEISQRDADRNMRCYPNFTAPPALFSARHRVTGRKP